MLDPLLTTQEAAEYLGLHEDTVKRYVLNGRLQGFKLPGGRYRIYADGVERLLRSGEVKPCADCGHPAEHRWHQAGQTSIGDGMVAHRFNPNGEPFERLA